MKHCSVCKLDLSDEYTYCTNCGGGLAAVTVAMRGAAPPVRAVALQPTIASPFYRDERYAAPAAESPKPKRLGLILAGVFVVLLLGLGSIAAYYFWFTNA